MSIIQTATKDNQALYEGENETDSFYGFLGKYDVFLTDVESYLPENCKGMTESLRDYCGDIANYFWRQRLHTPA